MFALMHRRYWKWRVWLGDIVLALPLTVSCIATSLADEIDVLSYNIYMRPFFHDGQAIRANYLVDQLAGFDAIVFQEAYDDKIRRLLLAGLHTEYPFSTHILGADAGISQDGGVIIVSKWPIVYEDQRLFTKGEASTNRCPGPSCCAGLDCYTDKGVVYALINKTGRCYHLFGTHLQSGSENWALRNAQFTIIKDFIVAKDIPVDEPVIIAGDMNVHRGDETRFAEMRALLNAEQPPLRSTLPPTTGTVYTFDGPGNDLNDNETTRRYIDYALYSIDHLSPISAFNQVRIIHSAEPWRQYLWQDWHRDLSDHYAVLGHFEYAENSNLSCPSEGASDPTTALRPR